MINSEKYKELIDYVLNEQEAFDRMQTESWIGASEKNRRIFEEIQKKSLFLKWSLSAQTLDKESELLKFRKRIRKKNNFQLQFSVAASILLVIGCFLFMILDSKQDNNNLSTYSHHIKHGQKGARLILSNGEKIAIGQQTIEIKKEKGTVIQVDSKSGLKYDSNLLVKSSGSIYNTLRVPLGCEYNLMLSDGTKVWLNAASELRYPINFEGDIRTVFLEGEAYFEVAKDTSKKFIVHAHSQEVIVYGTSFVINAYQREVVKTTLVSGIVSLKMAGEDKETLLRPGERGITNLKNGSVVVENVNVRTYIAWKDGDFVFDNECLEDIMSRIQRWYDVKVYYENDEAKRIHFTGDIKRYSNISDLLYFIEATSDAKFLIKDNTIVVKLKGNN